MRSKPPYPLLLVGLLFLGPFAAALLLYYGPVEPAWLPRLESADRVLLGAEQRLPRVPLHLVDGRRSSPDWARGRWSLIYARTGACEAPCLREMRRLSQVYYALGRDGVRVRRVVLLATPPPGLEPGPGLVVAELAPVRDAQLAARLGRGAIEGGRVLVADPLGNLVLSYPPDVGRPQLLEDLERLLELSRIG